MKKGSTHSPTGCSPELVPVPSRYCGIRLALRQLQKSILPPGLEAPWYVIEEWQEEPIPAPDDEAVEG